MRVIELSRVPMNITQRIPKIGRPIAFYPSVCRAFDDLSTAIIICQFIYWYSKVGDRLIYKTREEIEEETSIKPDTQRRIFAKLKKMGVVEIVKKGIPAKNHYQWNWKKVDEIITANTTETTGTCTSKTQEQVPADSQHQYQQDASTSTSNLQALDPVNCRHQYQQSAGTNTETTTETTTDNNTHAQNSFDLVPEKPKPSKPKKPKSTLSADDLVEAYGIDLQVAQDWLVVRKTKKAPLTQTALKLIENEAAKANLSVAQAIQFSCESGWVGFKAEWYENRQISIHNSGNSQHQKTEKEFFMSAESSMKRLRDTSWWHVRDYR